MKLLYEMVTLRIKDKEKIRETIGEARVMIFRWYRMLLLLSQENGNTVAELFITYEKPKGWLARFISLLVADWYCNWCLKNMLRDTGKRLESKKIAKAFQS